MEQNDVSFIHGVKFNELYPFEAILSEKYEFLGIELNTQRTSHNQIHCDLFFMHVILYSLITKLTFHSDV